jgi:hypothetical protein
MVPAVSNGTWHADLKTLVASTSITSSDLVEPSDKGGYGTTGWDDSKTWKGMPLPCNE